MNEKRWIFVHHDQYTQTIVTTSLHSSMKQILIGLILALCTPLALAGLADLPTSNTDLLSMLDVELKNRGKYEKKHRQQIDSLRREVAMTTDSLKLLNLYQDLGNTFHLLNADSSVIYFTKGLEIAKRMSDSVSIQRLFILRAREYRKLGAAHDGIVDLEHVKNSGIKSENFELFYDVGREISFSMSSLYPTTDAASGYLQHGLDFARKEIAVLQPDSWRYKLCKALLHLGEGEKDFGTSLLSDILNDSEITEPEFAIAATLLGEVYAVKPDYEKAIYYFGVGALSDIYRANMHGTSLLRLGEVLYNKKETARAHNYLSVALENALRADAKMNATMVSGAFMPVANDIQQNNDRRFMMLGAMMVCLLIACGGIAKMYIAKKQEMSKVQNVRFALAEANRSKETYMSQFMNLCSSYMESIEEYNRMCRRKITAGQSEDLLKVIKTGKIIDEQRKKFYDIFDDSFLNIYPTFVNEVNEMLIPEKRLVIPSPNVLTTELRILAFMRLGVEDTTQIARFLGVSLNTIYTYRNKMRTRAINRETFEDMVMKIGSFD